MGRVHNLSLVEIKSSSVVMTRIHRGTQGLPADTLPPVFVAVSTKEGSTSALFWRFASVPLLVTPIMIQGQPQTKPSCKH